MFNKIISLLLILLWQQSCSFIKQEYYFSGPTMGTTYHIKIISNSIRTGDINKINAGIDSVLNSINQQMSTYIFNSEISQLNAHESVQPFPVSAEFVQVVKRALYWSQKTNGAFDATIVPLLYLWGFGPRQSTITVDNLPQSDDIAKCLVHVGYNKISVTENTIIKSDTAVKLDLNSIAKGYGVDAVFNYIESNGINSIMVEIGGEVRTKGKNKKNKPWVIAVEQPQLNGLGKKAVWGVVSLENKAMATSGDYRNYFSIDNVLFSHIIDPRSGYPTQAGIASATVIADNCMDADALATALLVLSVDEGMELIESLEGVEAGLILRSGADDYTILKSTGMKINE